MTKNFWLPITVSLVILFFTNLIMVSSIAPALLLKQLAAWIIGIVLFFIGRQINPKQFSSYKWTIFILSCLLLLLPVFLNHITRGSRRWLDIGPLSIQPSEIVKPLLMLYLSDMSWPLLHFIPVAIIMLQPDLGSAMSVFFLLIPVIIYNQKIVKIFLALGLFGLLLSPLIWNNVLHDYQQKRIQNFLNPSNDPLGNGYNVIQSKIAVGSGGFFGKGYKMGTQGQLLFLPEKHTDFIFAATAEERGLVGIIVILFAYYLLINTLLAKAFSFSNNRHLFIFTLGITCQIWLQMFINVGMNLGILPVTGIPLPFLSVGGSSLMALMFSIGIIFSS